MGPGILQLLNSCPSCTLLGLFTVRIRCEFGKFCTGAMERSKSNRASVRAEDERKPLLSLQGDPNSYSPDRLSVSSSVSSTK